MKKFKCHYEPQYFREDIIHYVVVVEIGQFTVLDILLPKMFNQKTCIATYCRLIKLLKRKYRI